MLVLVLVCTCKYSTIHLLSNTMVPSAIHTSRKEVNPAFALCCIVRMALYFWEFAWWNVFLCLIQLTKVICRCDYLWFWSYRILALSYVVCICLKQSVLLIYVSTTTSRCLHPPFHKYVHRCQKFTGCAQVYWKSLKKNVNLFVNLDV